MNIDYFETNTNPFILDIEDKTTYSFDDYVKIQSLLENRMQSIDPFLESIYPEDKIGRRGLNDLKLRTKRGLYQKIIDASNSIIPEIEIYKIGDGGDGKKCFVCCTPLFSDRYEVSQSIAGSLENVGFNGHFMLLNGGYPNPSGTEMKYVGVPYSFKIFMMLEAKKRGFEKVIWIDSACFAVNNPEYLFVILEKYDAVFRSFPANCFEDNACEKNLFPKTLELMNTLCGRDIRNDKIINSIVFGLNFTSPKIDQFIEKYYEMVNRGLPFLSCFPEENVFSAILNCDNFRYILDNIHETHNLYVNEHYYDTRSAKENGFYFLQRKYNN